MWTWYLEVQESSCIKRKVIYQRWLSRKLKGVYVLDNISELWSKPGRLCFQISCCMRKTPPSPCMPKPLYWGFSNWQLKAAEKKRRTPKPDSFLPLRWTLALDSQVSHPPTPMKHHWFLLPYITSVSKFYFTLLWNKCWIQSFHKKRHQQSKPTSFLTRTRTTATTSWKTSLLLPFPLYNLPSTYTLSL